MKEDRIGIAFAATKARKINPDVVLVIGYFYYNSSYNVPEM